MKQEKCKPAGLLERTVVVASVGEWLGRCFLENQMIIALNLWKLQKLWYCRWI